MSAFGGMAITNEIALSAATAKTVVQIVAPTNHRVRVKRWGVYFDGVSVTEAPVVVQFLRQTTAGTMSSLTPVKKDDSLAETLQVTAQHTATSEPTAGDVLEQVNVHPQHFYENVYPPGDEVIVGGGDRIAIKCTAPAAVNVIGKIEFEE